VSTFDLRLQHWLRGHHATVPAALLGECGITRDQRDHLVASGMLARVVDGAYILAGVDVGEAARCAAVCSSRPDLVIAGPTAGRLWKLRRIPADGLVHVVAPPASHPCREPWVRAYRTALLDPEDVVARPDGIRVTSPARTALDMTRYVDAASLVSITEQVLSFTGLSEAALDRCAERLDTPGRPWVRRFRRMLAARRPGAPSESDPEVQTLRALEIAGVTDLVRQHAVVLAGYGRARFDLAIPPLRWALEIDVHPEHRTLEGAARDQRRDAAACAVGWTVRRVGEVALARDRFAATIGELVAEVTRRRAEVATLAAAGLWPPKT
jgi:hypothetical protein